MAPDAASLCLYGLYMRVRNIACRLTGIKPGNSLRAHGEMRLSPVKFASEALKASLAFLRIADGAPNLWKGKATCVSKRSRSSSNASTMSECYCGGLIAAFGNRKADMKSARA